MSVNRYGAAPATRLGLSAGDVRAVFPNLANFGAGSTGGHGPFDAT